MAHQAQVQQANAVAQQENAATFGFDLNQDPLEVIIDPIIPLQDLEFIELNDFIEVVEQNIMQPQQHHLQQANPVQNEAKNPNFVNGFAMPQLVDVLGEEVGEDQLIDMNDMNDNAGILDNLVQGIQN